jgi:uncharacterized protein YyaL (SSP411 family)
MDQLTSPSGDFLIENSKPNRLIHEKSPYLLQHAYNPVDWYPWDPEAFHKAEKEGKPIFLSIGYSTCHWCHVMERESFEDTDVAEAINDAFVSIKVDREERPDIDATYMKVCQMMTGSGGWPLSIIMTPDRRPFFAGTYIPKETGHGRIGMLDLIAQIKDIWENDRKRALDVSSRVVESLKLEPRIKAHTLGEETLKFAYLQLSQSFDPRHGGFRTAPKFPTPHNLLYLLRYWKRTGEEKALSMVERTLRSIRMGGVYDQIGFGVHRYSTDAHWLVPHFEKMLYDQALATMAYTETYQTTGDPFYRQVSEEIIGYVLSEMISPQGGFYSAEDADSEGEEGKFYVWTEDEIRDLLAPEELNAFNTVYNVSEEGNYQDEATRRKTGKNILHMKKTLAEYASELGITEESLKLMLEQSRTKLLETRGNRVRPHLDDKVLTSWNGLMIAALAKAGRALREPRYIEAASKTVDFILSTMRTPEGRILRRYRDGDTSISGFLEDYAFFVWGLLEMYESTFETNYLRLAIEYNDAMIGFFWDETGGGFFSTAADSEEILVREKEAYDGALPSANSVALLNLVRISKLTADPDLDGKMSALIDRFSEQVYTSPMSHTFFMTAMDFINGPSHEVVVIGSPGAEDTEAMLRALSERFLPNKVVLFIPDGETVDIAEIASYVKDYINVEERATAYVCVNFSCLLPVTSASEMLKLVE